MKTLDIIIEYPLGILGQFFGADNAVHVNFQLDEWRKIGDSYDATSVYIEEVSHYSSWLEKSIVYDPQDVPEKVMKYIEEHCIDYINHEVPWVMKEADEHQKEIDAETKMEQRRENNSI
jgi:hypothetical protein